ncbi:MAG: hypothetical protein ACFFB3_11200 [Candidatus Hodarchaeota archaeon]
MSQSKKLTNMNLELPMITLDIDWAPDWIIDEVRSILADREVKATWFVTHNTSAVDRLRDLSELFELGLHPNCLPNSTHGNTEEDILHHVKELVPEAVSMRTHGLYQSSDFLKKAAKDFGVKNDVSLILPGLHNLKPFQLKLGDVVLNRVPYFWEDDLEMLDESPSWSLSDPKHHGPGLKVYNFHPVHIFFNSPDAKHYSEFEARGYDLSCLSPDDARNFVYRGQGPRKLFLELVAYLARTGCSQRIRDLVEKQG